MVIAGGQDQGAGRCVTTLHTQSDIKIGTEAGDSVEAVGAVRNSKPDVLMLRKERPPVSAPSRGDARGLCAVVLEPLQHC